MNQTVNMIGMGCFGRGQNLQLRFRKGLDSFTWLRCEDLYPAAERMFHNESLRRFFRSVIRSGTERPDQIDRALASVSAATEINGFYLGVDEKSLNLIVFFQDTNGQSANLRIRLEKFSRLRKIRLH